MEGEVEMGGGGTREVRGLAPRKKFWRRYWYYWTKSTFCLCVKRQCVCLSHMTHLHFTGIEPTARQHTVTSARLWQQKHCVGTRTCHAICYLTRIHAPQLTEQGVRPCWLTTGDAFSHDHIQMSLAKDVPDVNHVAAALKQPVSAERWACSDRFGSSLFVASRWQIFAMQKNYRLSLALWYINHSVLALVMEKISYASTDYNN